MRYSTKIYKTTVYLALLGLSLGLSNNSLAQGSAAEAAEMAREKTGGTVLRVFESQDNYRVRVLLPTGQVRDLKIKQRSQKSSRPLKPNDFKPNKNRE